VDSYEIVWHDRLLIGEPTVDAQHKRLIAMIAGVSERAGHDDAVLLDAVLDYAATHFADEEHLMRRIGYPGLAAHVNSHKRLTRILIAYHKEYLEGKRDLYAFKNFMFSWVRDHIMDEDREIGLFIQQHRP